MDHLPQYWPMIAATILFIVWLVRLESKVLFCERTQEAMEKARLRERHESAESAISRETALWQKLDILNANVLDLTKTVVKLETLLENRK